jgi:hypothetical protein
MTQSDNAPVESIILKRDARGRVRTTAAQRAALLAEFARSGLSGPGFARVAGINYQTFACWRQEQRKASAALVPVRSASPPSVRLVEATLQAPLSATPVPGPLRVTLPGGALLIIDAAAQVSLAAQLIKALHSAAPC